MGELGRFAVGALKKLPEVGRAAGVLTLAIITDGRSIIPEHRAQREVAPVIEAELTIPDELLIDPPSDSPE